MTPPQQTSPADPLTDLSTFQVAILAVIAREGPQYGLALRDDLEASTNMKIYGGKLYPNLNQSADQSLIEKRTRDRRTNEYALTDEGERVLHRFHTWLSDCLGEMRKTIPNDLSTGQSTASDPKTDPEKRCTMFTTQHGLTNPAGNTFYFAFICPNCEHANPLKGSPRDFHEQSVRCLRCTWVAVLDETALEQFAEGLQACE